MNIHLIAVLLDRPLTEEEEARMLRMMPVQRRARLEKLTHEDLRDEPICAYAMLQMGLRTLYGWEEIPRMTYDVYGKPSFPEHPDVHFNISHTRKAVLVAIHDHPVGVDIEHIRPVSQKMMERTAGVSTPEEFFRSWVWRESRSKRSGNSVAPMRERVSTVHNGEYFHFIDTFPGYAACVCTQTEAEVEKPILYHLK